MASLRRGVADEVQSPGSRPRDVLRATVSRPVACPMLCLVLWDSVSWHVGIGRVHKVYCPVTAPVDPYRPYRCLLSGLLGTVAGGLRLSTAKHGVSSLGN